MKKIYYEPPESHAHTCFQWNTKSGEDEEWAQEDSNFRPTGYEPGALPTEL